jgi:hypothetical protein
MQQKSKIFTLLIALSVFHWISYRFTPSYALLIFFYVYIFPHLGSGPLWQSKIVGESENCAATWWANLLYLNNYMTMERLVRTKNIYNS